MVQSLTAALALGLLFALSVTRAGEIPSLAGAPVGTYDRLSPGGHPLTPVTETQPGLPAFDPLVQQMMDQVVSPTLYAYEAQLSGQVSVTVGGAAYTITTRNTRSGIPIETATQFIQEELAGDGYAAAYHNWTLSGDSGRNVIAELPGQVDPSRIYMLTAHLDDMPVSGTAPGADDNASGTAAVLAAAEIMSHTYWGCTLRFALFTGEEQGLKGSNRYAFDARGRNENILGVLNLDMLGYNGAPPRALNLYYKPTVAGSQQIADLFVNTVGEYGLGLAPVTYNVVTYTVGNQSDNASFWTQGYPAILAIEDYQGHDFTPYYHTISDTLSSLDLDYYTTMVKAAIGTFAKMTGCLIQDPPIAVSIRRQGDSGAALSWFHTAPNAQYQVWRDTKPYLQPGDAALVETLPAPKLGVASTYTDADATTSPGAGVYYLVRGVDSMANPADTSQRVGVVSYALDVP